MNTSDWNAGSLAGKFWLWLFIIMPLKTQQYGAAKSDTALEMANLAVHKLWNQNPVWTYSILILFTFKFEFGMTSAFSNCGYDLTILRL